MGKKKGYNFVPKGNSDVIKYEYYGPKSENEFKKNMEESKNYEEHLKSSFNENNENFVLYNMNKSKNKI